MHNELMAVLAGLQTERADVQAQIDESERKLTSLRQLRKLEVRGFVQRTVPDLSEVTIARLRQLLPDFHVPMVPKWHGFSKKLDPDMTLDQLRMQLGVYVDNAPSDVLQLSQLQKVREFNADILRAVEEQRDLSICVRGLDKQIDGLQKLLAGDIEKLPEDAKRKLSLHTETELRRIQSGQPLIVRTQSDNGIDVFTGWLYWHAILSTLEDAERAEVLPVPHAEYAAPPPSMAGEVVERGDVTEGTSAPASAFEADLAGQAALGSGSFS